MVEAKEKKKWYEIISSQHFNNQVIGETLANEDKNLLGRIIDVNLGTLTRDAKLQNIKVKFKISEIKENKAYTQFKGYELVSNYIKRIIRGGRSRVDDSFFANTNDNIKIRIKPLILTKYKTQRGVLTGLRDLVRKEFQEYIKRENYDKFISDIVSKRVHRELREKLNKIYPISIFEIRIMESI